MNRLFFQSKIIPEQYRKWFEKEFGKLLKGQNPGVGTNAAGAIEDIVEKFKEADKEIQHKEEKKKAIKIIKESDGC